MSQKRNTEEDIKMLANRRRFARMSEAAKHYAMGLSSFRALAREANAVYRIRKIVLVDLDQVDEYLETFHEFND